MLKKRPTSDRLISLLWANSAIFRSSPFLSTWAQQLRGNSRFTLKVLAAQGCLIFCAGRGGKGGENHQPVRPCAASGYHAQIPTWGWKSTDTAGYSLCQLLDFKAFTNAAGGYLLLFRFRTKQLPPPKSPKGRQAELQLARGLVIHDS